MSTRHLSEPTPSLFDDPSPAAERRTAAARQTAVDEEKAAGEEKPADKLARQFVRWCCSFGDGFRNSPDVLNLRYWAQKHKIKVKDRDEAKVLEAVRPLFLKRIEDVVRKSEPAH